MKPEVYHTAAVCVSVDFEVCICVVCVFLCLRIPRLSRPTDEWDLSLVQSAAASFEHAETKKALNLYCRFHLSI